MSSDQFEDDINLLLASIEHGADGVFVSDAQLRFSYVNERACEMSGYSKEELLAMCVPDLEIEFFKFAPGGIRPSKLYSGEAVTVYGTHRRKDGSTFPVEARVKFIYSEKGRHALALVRDISERKLKEENERQEAIVKERESFMAALAHDIKNPLLGSSNILHLLISGVLGEVSEEQITILKKLKESNDELIDLLQNLIEVYNFDREAKQLNKENVDILRVVNESIKELADERVSEIAIECTGGCGADTGKSLKQSDALFISADLACMKRLIKNLLKNNLKFARPEHTAIKLSSTESSITLEVSSSAYTLTEREREQVFQRLWQGLPGEHRYTPSAGLGMHLCKQIVEAHGGSIDCVCHPGKGTTYVVVLPLI